MKFVPQPLLISPGHPLRQMNLLNALIMESVFKVFKTSMCMVTDCQVRENAWISLDCTSSLLYCYGAKGKGVKGGLFGGGGGGR